MDTATINAVLEIIDKYINDSRSKRDAARDAGTRGQIDRKDARDIMKRHNADIGLLQDITTDILKLQ